MPRAARPHRHAAAPDVAAAEARVAARARARHVRGGGAGGGAAARWGGLKELLLQRLAGEWAVDHSCASGTGLLELASLEWDAEALELAGVDASQLGTLVATTERF